MPNSNQRTCSHCHLKNEQTDSHYTSTNLQLPNMFIRILFMWCQSHCLVWTANVLQFPSACNCIWIVILRYAQVTANLCRLPCTDRNAFVLLCACERISTEHVRLPLLTQESQCITFQEVCVHSLIQWFLVHALPHFRNMAINQYLFMRRNSWLISTFGLNTAAACFAWDEHLSICQSEILFGLIDRMQPTRSVY